MTVCELRQQLEVDTPRGRGRLWLVTEYGLEIEKVFTVLLHNGEIWEFTNKDLRLTPNITSGRTRVETGVTAVDAAGKAV